MKITIKNLFAESGTTLVELIVVVFIIALFSMMVVSNFPQIQKQYALASATYQIVQDLRSAEDLGLSGAQTPATSGAIPAKGYGIYINPGLSATKYLYLVYADVSDGSGHAADQKYNGDFGSAYNGGITALCSNQLSSTLSDCIVKVVDISKINPSLSVYAINDAYGNTVAGGNAQINNPISINFLPPSPIVNIIDSQSTPHTYTGIQIVLSNDGGTTTRKVIVNTDGLISVQ